MSEFTPGPWEADEGNGGLIAIYAGPIAIAGCYFGSALDIVRGGEVMANARLIAAAPELLELAKRIQWLLAQRNYPGRERDEATILKEAEAAIQKAIGQAVPHA